MRADPNLITDKSMLYRFFRSEPAAAIVLLAAAVLAMLVANSPLGSAYDDLLHTDILGLSVQHWINDGLMAVFFLLVGLEIKEELLEGELATWRSRALPGLAAVGGMAVPALVFVLINRSDSLHLDGWAIPAATDIAFAIGVLAILGSRVPIAVRLLLVGIAIVDDLLAIVVIALFYSSGIALPWLAGAVGCMVVLFAMNKLGVHRVVPYLVVGLGLWLTIYNSGLHATLAGVILAFAIPASTTHEQHRSPLKTTEHTIDRWVNFGILPVFGFANAGIAFGGLTRQDVIGTLPAGIALGLFLGKQVGIFGAIWLLIRFRVATMPAQLTWAHLHAMSAICGIGFTMSLFIGGLAFANYPELMNATRVGVIGGSLISATVGVILMRRATVSAMEGTPVTAVHEVSGSNVAR
jgi:NhaA family Na+:H+ antiporter